MTNFVLPSVFNERPTRSQIKLLPGIEMPGVATKVARNIYIRCRIAEAQNWRCCWCGTECRPEPDFPNSATIEHIHPRSLGGVDHRIEEDPYENYAMACNRCNHRRGTLSIEDFMAGKVAVGDGETAKRNQHERNQNRRFNKYVRKVSKFNATGWTRAGKPYCPEQWLSDLKITDCRRDKLRKLIAA